MNRAASLAGAFLVAVTAVGGCSPPSDQPPAPPRSPSSSSRLLGPDAFAATVAGPDRVTLNVHVPFEGDIRGTDLSLAYNRIRELADRLPAPGTPLAIYCRTGSMSGDAAPVLARLGYDDVVELDGGMVAWVDSGRPLIGRRESQGTTGPRREPGAPGGGAGAGHGW